MQNLPNLAFWNGCSTIDVYRATIRSTTSLNLYAHINVLGVFCNDVVEVWIWLIIRFQLSTLIGVAIYGNVSYIGVIFH